MLSIHKREVAVAAMAAAVGVSAVLMYLVLRGSSGDEDTLPRYANGAEIGGDDIVVEGVLVVEGGCLYYDPIRSESHLARGLLIFPEKGGVWDEQSGTLTFEGRVYEPGDLLFHAETGIGQGFAWANEPASGCDHGRYWPAEAGARVPDGAGEPPQF